MLRADSTASMAGRSTKWRARDSDATTKMITAGGISLRPGGQLAFDRQRTDTRMTIAAGGWPSSPQSPHLVRPGMNVIVNDSRKWVPLIILLLIMLAISLTRCVGPGHRAGVDQPTWGGVRKMIAQATAG